MSCAYDDAARHEAAWEHYTDGDTTFGADLRDRQNDLSLRQEQPVTEYAFDVHLKAVIRVKAESEAAARERLVERVQCVPDRDTRLRASGLTLAPRLVLTEMSVRDDDGFEPFLFEVGGVMLE